MRPNKDYRDITENELNQTSVYRFKVDSWSGKKNWEEKQNKQKTTNG